MFRGDIYIVMGKVTHEGSYIDSVWHDSEEAEEQRTKLEEEEQSICVKYVVEKWGVKQNYNPSGNDYILAECARPKGVF